MEEYEGPKSEEFLKHIPSRISYDDIEELACYILNLDEDAVDYDDVEQAIAEKFDCSLESFKSIIGHLLPMADSASSGLTGEVYRGFSIPLDDEGSRMWAVKERV